MNAMIKVARLSTARERERSRMYRQQNKAKVRLARKKRERLQRSGAKLKKSRIGSAAGGYSFVMASPQTSGSSSGGVSPPRMQATGRQQFPVEVASRHTVRKLGR